MTAIPRVTFVLVSYNGKDMLTSCLDTLAEHTPGPYEVVVVDSASPDGTGEWLEANLTGATVLRMPENLGFGAGCNLGVQHARTELICFLNADVEVTPGWFEPLLARLDATPAAAAVGSVLVFPDGRLQEAGSVIGGDGWSRGWGDGDVDLSPLYPRSADYSSAACLLMRRRAFWETGGFSPEFHIAYFEDTDLQFHLRSLGWQIWVEPASQVRHIRHGSSTTPRAIELSTINHEVFVRRWPEALATRPPAVGVHEHPHRLWWLRDQQAPYRVLLTADQVPDPSQGQGAQRAWAVIQYWRQANPEAAITVLATHGEATALRVTGVEVSIVDNPTAWGRDRAGLYDVIVALSARGFPLAEEVARTQPQAIRLFDTQTFQHREAERRFSVLPDASARRHCATEAATWREAEQKALTWAELSTVGGTAELDWATRHAPQATLRLAPYPVHPTPAPAGPDRREGLLFYGAFAATATSNEVAARTLITEVLPLLDAPRLRIIGAHAPAALRAPGVDVIGWVPDPAPYLCTARVLVNPAVSGAGTQTKLLDAMAHGLPFVTTALGAEGIPLGDLRGHLIAESPAELAELTQRLLDDDAKWTAIQATLLELAATHFTEARFGNAMAEVLIHCGIAPPTRTYACAR
ncbi:MULTISPECIES: glycosyltransferase [unclassified Crossiella]|uniref:glycosyltransferase n=1 Tax=unclassified Crossiella TaxID=2620835 RepID=UPI00200044DF|nr:MULTISPECIES: glycosyltransferase [unclassified Crossiella]MCK2245186.1 glycosyltransferase [Crossiella sp. S99.2]MCK2258839.1 glycosyltransferase [Crossiella sp. S99.1]